MKRKTINTLVALAALATLNAAISTTHAQGSLTPPAGVPAPVMKSLDQIEARTPLTAGAPGVVYSNGCYTITQPGSYYLTGEITVGAGLTGVSFHTGAATLDLNGFTITGVSSNCYGITDSEEFGAPGNRILNGTIRNCTYGISVNGQFVIDSVRVLNCAQDGIFVYGQNSVINRCTVQSCRRGIRCGDLVTITDCRVFQCFGTSSALGISVDSGTISRCSVSSVSAQTAQGIVNYNGPVSDCEVSSISSTTGGCQGIVAAQVRNCSVNNLFSSSSISTGILASGHGIISNSRIGSITGASGGAAINAANYRLQVRGCEVNDVFAAGGTAYGISSGSQGFLALTDCVITSVTNTAAGLNCFGIHSSGGVINQCTVTRAKSYGIYAAGDTSVLNSRVVSVKDLNSGTGIFVAGSGNRIDGNSVTGCYKGIEMSAASAMVVRNHASGNTTNYVNLPAGFVVSGYASMASSSNPFVNADF